MLPVHRDDPLHRRNNKIKRACDCCVPAVIRFLLRYGVFFALPLLIAALAAYDILRSRIRMNRDYKYPMGFIYWPVPDAYPYGLTARQLQTLFTMYRIDGILRFALMEALDYTFFPLWGITLLSFAHYTLVAGVQRRIGPLLTTGPSIIRLLLWLTVLGSIFDSIENTITLQAATHYEKQIKSTPLKIRNLACNFKFMCLASTLVIVFLLLHLAARVQLLHWKQRRTRKTPELIA